MTIAPAAITAAILTAIIAFRHGQICLSASPKPEPMSRPVPFHVQMTLSFASRRYLLCLQTASCACNASWSFTAMTLLNHTDLPTFPRRFVSYRRRFSPYDTDTRLIPKPSLPGFTPGAFRPLACRSLSVYASGRYPFIPYIGSSVQEEFLLCDLFSHKRVSPLP